MENEKETLTGDQWSRFNDCIAILYRMAHRKGALIAVVDAMSKLIPAEIHLAYTTSVNGDVDYAIRSDDENEPFFAAASCVAERHWLNFQSCGGELENSVLFTPRIDLAQDQCHVRSHATKMGESLGIDFRISPEILYSMGVIRRQGTFTHQDRTCLKLLVPHVRNVTEREGLLMPRNDRFRLVPLKLGPGATWALHRMLRDSLRLCPTVALEVIQWIRDHGITETSRSQTLSIRSEVSKCSAFCLPPERQRDALVALRADLVTENVSREPRALTPRETEIGHWLCQDKSNAEIAIILGIAPGTVKRHLENIYQKLDVPNRASAARQILKNQKNKFNI